MRFSEMIKYVVNYQNKVGESFNLQIMSQQDKFPLTFLGILTTATLSSTQPWPEVGVVGKRGQYQTLTCPGQSFLPF